MLGEVVVGCLAREGEIRRRWQMRQNFVAQILKHWLGNVGVYKQYAYTLFPLKNFYK